MKREQGTRSCRACGCTDLNCSACIARTGTACHWVEADLCSACAEFGATVPIRIKLGNTNIAQAKAGGKMFRASSTSCGLNACLAVAEKAAMALRADSGRVEHYKELTGFAGRAVLVVTFKAGGAA